VSDFPRTLIIVPSYNEQETLPQVTDSIRAYAPWADVAVVNDGSRDATPAIARAKGVILLDLPYNLGIGGAVQTGYKFAAKMGYDVAVQVDADGQHPPAAIEGLVRALVETESNMIIGSRYVPGGEYEAPPLRFVGIRVLSAVISLLAGQRIMDTTSGFRAVDRRTICFLARMYPRDYPEPETIVLLCREGFRILEFPVSMKARMAGQSSINLLHGLYYMIKVLLATIVDIFEERTEKGVTL
jgi:glycosyltransferase involved in cell wall biosynthesis